MLYPTLILFYLVRTTEMYVKSIVNDCRTIFIKGWYKSYLLVQLVCTGCHWLSTGRFKYEESGRLSDVSSPPSMLQSIHQLLEVGLVCVLKWYYQ